MATDTLARYGLEPAPLAPETFQKLDAFLPPFWSRGNPVDILGDASAERFRRTLEICFDGKETDGVCVILAPQALTDPILVGDDWQGKGIGSNLLEKCLSIAEKQGFESVRGIVPHENRNMLALGKKLGFGAKRAPDSGENVLTIYFG